MQVEVLKSGVTDNYFYLVWEGGEGILIDPVDAGVALEAVGRLGVRITEVVNTHWHGDHTAGNGEVLAATRAVLSVPWGDREHIQGGDRFLRGGDVIKVGEGVLEVWETPGHTAGHVSLYGEGRLFCGDTVFVGGAGNCRFGGDPVVLAETFARVLSRWGDAVEIFSGHDYARQNLRFCLHLEPENEAARRKLEAVEAAGGAWVRSSLGEERAYSPFFRSARVAGRVRALLGEEGWLGLEGGEEVRAFVGVRALRNGWR